MSEFSSDGFDSFPNLYADREEVKEVAEWSKEKIAFKLGQYSTFLSRSDLMPRATATATTITDLIRFEIGYSEGLYSNLDELLQEKQDGTVSQA